MKRSGILSLKLAGLAIVFVSWCVVAQHSFPFFWSIALMWGTVVFVPLLAACGRLLLDRHPTPERATVLTVLVHYLEMILIGCTLIIAFSFTRAHPIARIPFPQAISFPLLQLLGILTSLTVLNLAIAGFGLPFAAVLSKRLATNWLYARSRNPMLFSCLLFFIVGAVWLQSLHAVLWTILWLSPAWIMYVRIYEERELELRFGESYLQYKARTPFFFWKNKFEG